MASRFVRWFLLAGFGLAILVPVSLVFFSSFKAQSEFYKNPIGWPNNFTFSNYIEIFTASKMAQYIMNSAVVTVSTVAVVLFLSTMIAYAITRIGGKKGLLLYGLFAVGMMVPAQVNMIPLYALVFKLKLTNSTLGLIIVSSAVLLPIAVFILAGFMKTISRELFEASSIDGAKEWTIYSRVILPISTPSIAATAIFLFVMVWNDLLYALLFISKDAKKTLPLALLQFQGEFNTNMPMIFTGVMIASAPMVLAYIFLQRYFVFGITAGSVKG